MDAQKVYVEGLARLPVFCHATIAGDFIYVSGTLGTKPDSLELVEGGVGAQTTQTLRNIEQILQACGASLAHLIKVNVFLADINTFGEMNAAYRAVIGDDPPARITVGRTELALGAAVEIDAEKDNEKIAVEVKSFLSPSAYYEFHAALGQFLNYREVLEEYDPIRLLYLAVPEEIYMTLFQREMVQRVLLRYNIRVIVFNPMSKEILLWKK